MSKHDKIMRAKTSRTLRSAVDRILRTWDRATPTIVGQGHDWYSDAHAVAVDLAHQGNITLEHAAAVIAHLSPRTRWATNIAGAYAVVLKGNGTGLLQRNVNGALRALAALDGEAALATLNGPKTKRFAANILGDVEAVTVDVWAAKVAGVSEKELGRAGVYDAVEHAYRVAARRRGVDPAIMQACTWIVARNGRAA